MISVAIASVSVMTKGEDLKEASEKIRGKEEEEDQQEMKRHQN